MPEFHNLQCYTGLDSRTFRDAVSRFGAVLRACGVRDDRVDEYLRTVDGKEPAEGFVFTGRHAWVEFESAGFHLRGAPHIVGYTPDVFPGQDRGWLEVGMLFETEDLQTGSSFSTWAYRPGLGAAIWNLMKHFGPAFSDVGVFFTDEAQDGQPLEGIVEDTDARWQFDLAWIPENIADRFPPRPDAFIRHPVSGGIGMARTDAWSDPPWPASDPPS
jgi:hypothetical protein